MQSVLGESCVILYIKNWGMPARSLGLAACHMLCLCRQDPINAFAAILKTVFLLKLEKLKLCIFWSDSFLVRGCTACGRSVQRSQGRLAGQG